MTVPLDRRPSRRQAAVAVLATAAVVTVGLVVSGSGGASAGTGSPRTATAEVRDLRVTDDDRGTLARSDTTTVLYDGTGGRSDGGPAGSNLVAQAALQATPASINPDPTPDPCPPTSPPSTIPGPTTSTTVCVPTTTTTRPTTTITAPPTTTSTSTTAPPPVVEEPPAAEEPDGGDRTMPPADEARGPMADGAAPDQQVSGPDGAAGPSRATLTELLAVGATATRGSVLYRADDEPIVALLSATPLFRDLRVGVTHGPDVQALEAELRELGYSGFTVDEHFDSATAAAVQRWEADLDRATPDGVVTVGEVRFLEEPTAVLEHTAAVGDLLEPDDAVMVLGAESRVIEADVAAKDVKGWAVGTSVEVGWADGTSSTGSVVEVGRDVTDSQVAIVIALEDGSGTAAPIGSRVDLFRTVEERTGAVAIPVSAVVDGPDGPAVRVVGSKRDQLVEVELGIVDDGWVEVTKGVEEGTEVRLPS